MDRQPRDSSHCVLPLVRWTGSKNPFRLEFEVGEVSVLADAGVVGTVVLEGEADVEPARIWIRAVLKVTTREICVRSLQSFEHPLHADLTIFALRHERHSSPTWDDESDDEFRVVIPADLRELDVTDAIREIVILERPPFPLAPGEEPLGAENSDNVALPEHQEPEPQIPDSRWDVLRRLARDDDSP